MSFQPKWPHPGFGPDNQKAKLKPEQVDQIKTLREAGASIRAIARDYGLSPSTVHDLVKGKSYPRK